MPVHEAFPMWVTLDEQVAIVDGTVVGAALCRLSDYAA